MSSGYWIGDYWYDGVSDVASKAVDPYGRVHFIDEERDMHTEATTEEVPVVPMTELMEAGAHARQMLSGYDRIGTVMPGWLWAATPQPVLDELRRLLREKGLDLFAHGKPDSEGNRDRIVLVRA